MKRVIAGMFVAALCLSPAMTRPAQAETTAQEAKAHPRIVAAIREMEGSIKYMEAAPHDFGGHKAAAIQATRAAIEQLRLALTYRAGVDTAHGK